MVKMVEIPDKLKREEFRFIKVKNKSKQAFELNWSTINNYKYNDDKILNYLKEDTNYGVLGGYGNLLIIDADDDEISKSVEENLKPTFTVKTGSNKKHYYYICKDLESSFKLITLQNNLHKHWGDIQYNGRMVVGANSTHPNGNKYEIIKDIDIVEITRIDLINTLKDYINNDNEIREEIIKNQEEYKSDIEEKLLMLPQSTE